MPKKGDDGKICILYSQDKDAVKIKVRDCHYKDCNILYPIPQREIDLHSKLKQNPGYDK